MKLDGAVAVVTGAASGIGRATAVRFAGHGARLVLVDLDEAALEDLAAELRAQSSPPQVVVADVSRPDDIRRSFAFVEEVLGGPDLLHNNAAIMTGHEVWLDAPPERLAQVVAVNLAGVCMGTQAAVRSMLRRDGGSIVNTASTVALRPMQTDPVYAATKAGVVHLTKSLGYLSSSGIAVNAVLPGLTDTPLLSKTAPSGVADWLAVRLEEQPAMRPEAVAAAVVDVVLSGCVGEAVEVAAATVGQSRWP